MTFHIERRGSCAELCGVRLGNGLKQKLLSSSCYALWHQLLFHSVAQPGGQRRLREFSFQTSSLVGPEWIVPRQPVRGSSKSPAQNFAEITLGTYLARGFQIVRMAYPEILVWLDIGLPPLRCARGRARVQAKQDFGCSRFAYRLD